MLLPLAVLTACGDAPLPIAPEASAPSFHTTSTGLPKFTFTTASQWTLLRNASILPNGSARLTPAAYTQVGAMWYQEKTVVTQGFQAEFSFTMTPCVGGAADGIAFVVHDDPAGLGAIGGVGGLMGYHGLRNALVVEFDNFNNGTVDLNTDRSIAIHRSVGRGGSVSYLTPLQSTALQTPIADGQPHTVLITYQSGSLTVLLDGVQRIQRNIAISDIMDAQGKGYAGFTAATGGLCATQIVLNSPNTLPVANVGGPYAGTEGATIAMTAGASTDANGDPLIYAWDLDNNGMFNDATGVTATRVFDDNGSFPIRVRVTDHHGGQSISMTSVAVTNVAPSATFVVPTAAVSEGSGFSVSLTNVIDPSPVDVAAGFTYAFDCGTGFGAFGTASVATCTAIDNSAQTVSAKVRDKNGAETMYSASVPVANVAPTASLALPATATLEGSPFTFALDGATDAGTLDLAAGFTYAFDCGSGYAAFATSASASCATIDEGTRNVRAKVRDKDGAETEYTGSVSIINVAPSLGMLTVPIAPIAAGNPVTISAPYTDPGVEDIQSASVIWDIGGTPVTATVSNGVVSATQTLPAGVYTATLTINDGDGGTDQVVASTYIVVFDASAGHVTGGGWFNSSAGDCTLTTACTAASGKTNFGFVSRYRPGATTPDGNTEFDFKAGNFRFRSTSYEWLVVAGARAQYKGRGVVNGGSTQYGFLLTATDGGQTGGGGTDKFRLKVWDIATGVVVYDNQRGIAEDSDAGTVIGGGSIQINR